MHYNEQIASRSHINLALQFAMTGKELDVCHSVIANQKESPCARMKQSVRKPSKGNPMDKIIIEENPAWILFFV